MTEHAGGDTTDSGFDSTTTGSDDFVSTDDFCSTDSDPSVSVTLDDLDNYDADTDDSSAAPQPVGDSGSPDLGDTSLISEFLDDISHVSVDDSTSTTTTTNPDGSTSVTVTETQITDVTLDTSVLPGDLSDSGEVDDLLSFDPNAEIVPPADLSSDHVVSSTVSGDVLGDPNTAHVNLPPTADTADEIDTLSTVDSSDSADTLTSTTGTPSVADTSADTQSVSTSADSTTRDSSTDAQDGSAVGAAKGDDSDSLIDKLGRLTGLGKDK